MKNMIERFKLVAFAIVVLGLAIGGFNGGFWFFDQLLQLDVGLAIGLGTAVAAITAGVPVLIGRRYRQRQAYESWKSLEDRSKLKIIEPGLKNYSRGHADMQGTYQGVEMTIHRYIRGGDIPSNGFGIFGNPSWQLTLVRAGLGDDFPADLHVCPALSPVASIMARQNPNLTKLEAKVRKVDGHFSFQAEDLSKAVKIVRDEDFQQILMELRKKMKGVRICEGGLQVAIGHVAPLSVQELEESLEFIADAAKRLSAGENAERAGQFEAEGETQTSETTSTSEAA